MKQSSKNTSILFVLAAILSTALFSCGSQKVAYQYNYRVIKSVDAFGKAHYKTDTIAGNVKLRSVNPQGTGQVDWGNGITYYYECRPTNATPAAALARNDKK